jgi:hypothetical protein
MQCNRLVSAGNVQPRFRRNEHVAHFLYRLHVFPSRFSPESSSDE